MSIIFGISGFELTKIEIDFLKNKNSSGVILFTRNYKNKEQLKDLCRQIREVAPEKLLCVDHEGGRVQRFREQFSALPPMYELGEFYKENQSFALKIAEAIGIIIASELEDFDFSFTPVLDLYNPISKIIANRAFSENPEIVSALSIALRKGLRLAGMPAVGKHYAGHGNIEADSHDELCYDFRALSLRNIDKIPFKNNIADGIEALMTAHIIYPESAGLPLTFSKYLLDDLRHNLKFQGAIISDDLDMAGAKIPGTYPELIQKSLDAGADACLVCNNFAVLEKVLNHDYQTNPDSPKRLQNLKRKNPPQKNHYHQALTVLETWTNG